MANQNQILLTESNVVDIYKKLVNKENISQEEIEQVKERFYELVNCQQS